MRTLSMHLIRSFSCLLFMTVGTSLATTHSALAAPRGEQGRNIVTVTYGEAFLYGKDVNSLYGGVSVRLGDYPGDPSLAVVTATFGGKTYPLEWIPMTEEFSLMGPFNSISELKTFMNGTYVIDIVGASSSTSTFNFNASALTSSMIYSQPRSLTPANGVTVTGDEPCTWVKPLRGPATPFFIACYRDDLDSGLLPSGTTTWNPGVCMEAGPHSMSVDYVALTPTNLYTPITVTSGSIVWSNYAFMPPTVPSTGPAMATLGSAITDFTSTGEACSIVGDLDGDGSVGAADLSLLLVAWGTASNTADLDGDGDVGASDLSLLLVNWG